MACQKLCQNKFNVVPNVVIKMLCQCCAKHENIIIYKCCVKGPAKTKSNNLLILCQMSCQKWNLIIY